jgi:hypothetical protein
VWTVNNNIIVAGDSSLISGSDITLRGKTYSSGGNFNLTINAANDANIENDIGTAPGINRSINATIDNNGLINELRVIAGNDIDLFADVTTKNLQDYTANSINIGSVAGTAIHNQVNWNLSGTTGYSNFDPAYVKENNASLVRTLISVDPTIRFNGAVNDAIEGGGMHSLVTIAISRSRSQYADVIFGSTIGAERKLYSVSARTIEYLEGALAPNDLGTIKLGGNISTVADQRYQSTMFEVTGNAPIIISSEVGTIYILTTAYQMAAGISFDYSYSNPPEIAAAPGLIRLADIVRNTPLPSTEISAGVLSNRLFRMALFKDETNDSVDAEVDVGNIESGGSVECEPGQDPADCQFKL